MNAFSPNRNRSSPDCRQIVRQLSTKPTPFSGHHLDSQRLKEGMQLNMSSLIVLGRGPEKNMKPDVVFAHVHTVSVLILVTSNWRNQVSVPLMGMTILPYLRLAFVSSFKFDSVLPALAPGMHLTMVAGVANLTFHTMELPMT